MSDEEIDALKPGREMDAHVWLALNGRAGESIFLCRSVDGDIQPNTGTQAGHISPPHYSTSIADAWRVFYHMEDMGYEVCIESSILRFPEYRVVFSKDTFMNDQCFTESKSLPESICKAALKAVNHE